jgi:stress response protein SCP2
MIVCCCYGRETEIFALATDATAELKASFAFLQANLHSPCGKIAHDGLTGTGLLRA